jgi:hypothetical protein
VYDIIAKYFLWLIKLNKFIYFSLIKLLFSKQQPMMSNARAFGAR